MPRTLSLDKGEAIKIPFACTLLVLCFLFLPFELQTGGRERFGGGERLGAEGKNFGRNKQGSPKSMGNALLR